MFEKRNKAGRHSYHLLWRHVDELNAVGANAAEVATETGHNAILVDMAAICGSVGRGQGGSGFFIRPQPNYIIRELLVANRPVGRDQEAVIVDLRVNGQTGNQSDIRTLGRFDRTNAAIVRNMHVTYFEAGPLAIEAAGAQRRQSPFVRQLRQRIGLVDDLRQFTAAEEVLYRG